MAVQPKGVTYNWSKDHVEYQLWPEAFFSGADVGVYFGDIWLEDILGLSFVLQEQVKPLYSYASRTYKEVARGNRIVTGRFYIAFRRAGYLSSILDHISDPNNLNKSDAELMEPYLATAFSGDLDISWQAVAKYSYTEYLKQNYIKEHLGVPDEKNPVDDIFAEYEKEIWGRNRSQDRDHEEVPYFYTSKSETGLQDSLLSKGFDIYMVYGAIDTAVKGVRDTKKILSFNNTVKAIRNVQLVGCSQEIGPDNTMVEVYDFIAKDCD